MSIWDMKDSKSKILLVDDDPQLLREVQAHLETLGYEVATASDGLGGLKVARSMLPDLVVLDINFPDSQTARNRSIDGIDVLRRLRDSGNVPVLMLSSCSIAAVKVMALTIGADDYLAKPFDLQELSARIAAILCREAMCLKTRS
jgi:DNA-binding response OmpR family regulator